MEFVLLTRKKAILKVFEEGNCYSVEQSSRPSQDGSFNNENNHISRIKMLTQIKSFDIQIEFELIT